MRISDWSSDVCSSDLRGAWILFLPRALSGRLHRRGREGIATAGTGSGARAQLHPGDRRDPVDGDVLLDWRGGIDGHQCHLALAIAGLDDLHELAPVLGLHHALAAVALGGFESFVAGIAEVLAILEARRHGAAAHHHTTTASLALRSLDRKSTRLDS